MRSSREAIEDNAKDEGMRRADEVNIELYGGPTNVTKDYDGYNYLTRN